MILNKRGQATIFVVLGIIIVALIILFFAARSTIFLPLNQESLSAELEKISNTIEECLLDNPNGINANELVILMGKQGGYLNPEINTYLPYQDNSVSYLCYNIVNEESCYNRVLLLSNMEEQLNERFESILDSCLDLSSFERFKPYKLITPKIPTVDTEILESTIIINLNFPVTLKSDESELSRELFTYTLEYPLGELYQVSQDVLDSETEIGKFDSLTYMLRPSIRGEVIVTLLPIYPHKLYTIKRNDNEYLFQFAVQGEAR